MSDCINRECSGKKDGVCLNDFPGVKCYGYEPPRKTNADTLRAMSDEELAEYLDGVCHDLWQMFVKDPQKMWLDWLRQEATE